MKAIALFARTTIVGGVFFLAPIVVLIVILTKAFGFAKTGLHAVVPHIPGISDLSVGVATALSTTMMALACLLAGLVAHILIAQRLKQENAGALGVAEIGELPVMCSCPWKGGWQLGVQTERLSTFMPNLDFGERGAEAQRRNPEGGGTRGALRLPCVECLDACERASRARPFTSFTAGLTKSPRWFAKP